DGEVLSTGKSVWGQEFWDRSQATGEKYLPIWIILRGEFFTSLDSNPTFHYIPSETVSTLFNRVLIRE
ncbi:MAG: hypothetical protein CMN56_15860, partial [Sneathiella sp.]|uniref:hypothetical protein n=1 Tax=Sneathiella sp. TaxID=1964365 RepID=UPI000C66458B